jgi:hypothetical protein
LGGGRADRPDPDDGLAKHREQAVPEDDHLQEIVLPILDKCLRSSVMSKDKAISLAQDFVISR